MNQVFCNLPLTYFSTQWVTTADVRPVGLSNHVLFAALTPGVRLLRCPRFGGVAGAGLALDCKEALAWLVSHWRGGITVLYLFQKLFPFRTDLTFLL